MGRPKLLLPWGDSTVIEQQLAAWRASRVSCVVVVVHPLDDELALRCRASGVNVVVPAEAPPQMKDSVACGLAHVERMEAPASGDAWLLAPADVPRLATHVVDRLLDEHASGDAAEILVPVDGGKRGHPVLFPWPLAAEVAHLAEDEGVSALLDRNRVREIDCGPHAAPDDLDTPDDYRRLRDS